MPCLLHDGKGRIAKVHQFQILNIKEETLVGGPIQLVAEDPGVFGHPFLSGDGKVYPGFPAVLLRENRVIAQEIPLSPQRLRMHPRHRAPDLLGNREVPGQAQQTPAGRRFPVPKPERPVNDFPGEEPRLFSPGVQYPVTAFIRVKMGKNQILKAKTPVSLEFMTVQRPFGGKGPQNRRERHLHLVPVKLGVQAEFVIDLLPRQEGDMGMVSMTQDGMERPLAKGRLQFGKSPGRNLFQLEKQFIAGLQAEGDIHPPAHGQ